MSELQRRKMLGWMGAAAVGATAMSLEGCVTARLYEDTRYAETFSAMYITQDRRQIVILGPRFHYIFDAPFEMPRLVQSELHADLRASFDGFVVASDQTITGTYKLVLNRGKGGYRPEQASQAETLGMRSDSGGQLALSGSLKGRRYAAGQAPAGDQQATALNRSYTVSIREQPTVGGAMGRLALTPVTVAADGVLMLTAMVLTPFVLAQWFANCNHGHSCH